ncbi:stage II sporulation protein M [Halobacteroides halobius DSM 5150]|uniref:Stage II sporulation protein M n=1 Tax=Halobacteroides halobius (strain ATCC 35273 / DSM 5150 / MD-1) TaxID=748449 RepID=L0K864_HALHC|nr:stage II sporulation protein M [Halobacteroides halobius]AGB40554.1 stage II sporulation protein M [Halobacteroides halobius DSM 5150]
MLNHKWRSKQFSYYITNHIFLVLIVLVFFAIGLIAGSIAVNTLDYQQKESLVSYLDQFIVQVNQLLNNQQHIMLKKIIFSNLKFIFILWLLGLTIVGAIIAPIIICLKGFIIGFTISFLIKELFLQGLLLAIVSILPQNLIIIPSLLLGCLFSLIYSTRIGMAWIFSRKKRRYNFSQAVLKYSVLMLILAGCLFLAGLIEAYLTPNLVELVASNLIN